MIISMAWMNGMNNQMVENTIRTSLGHIAIHSKGFQDDMKLDKNFYPAESIIKTMSDNPGIIAFAPKVKLQGMIRSSEASRGVMIVGINPEKEKNVSALFEYTSFKNGSRFLNKDDHNMALISKSLAERLDLIIGDRLVLMFQDRNNEIVGNGMKIVGLFTTPIDSFDKYMVFVPIKRLQELTNLGNNISEITILVKNSRNISSIKEYLKSGINSDSIDILTWKEMAPNLVSAIKLFDSMMYVFFMIIFITVIFSVANTLIMSIMERFHEIGVMKSIGTRPTWIFFITMFEALNLGIVGLVIGITTGTITAELLSIHGIDFSFYMESMRTWGTGSIIYPAIKTMDIIAATIIVMLTTIIAALYPAFKAARIKPLEALHYV